MIPLYAIYLTFYAVWITGVALLVLWLGRLMQRSVQPLLNLILDRFHVDAANRSPIAVYSALASVALPFLLLPHAATTAASISQDVVVKWFEIAFDTFSILEFDETSWKNFSIAVEHILVDISVFLPSIGINLIGSLFSTTGFLFLLIFLVALPLITAVMSSVFAPAFTSSGAPTGSRRYQVWISNALLIAVLAASTYLSVSAIIAIQVYEENQTNSKLDATAFKTNLQGALGLVGVSSDGSMAAAQLKPFESSLAVMNLNQVGLDLSPQAEALIVVREVAYSSYISTLPTVPDKAAAALNVTLQGDIGKRAAEDHYNELFTWAVRFTDRAAHHLSICDQAILRHLHPARPTGKLNIPPRPARSDVQPAGVPSASDGMGSDGPAAVPASAPSPSPQVTDASQPHGFGDDAAGFNRVQEADNQRRQEEECRTLLSKQINPPTHVGDDGQPSWFMSLSDQLLDAKSPALMVIAGMVGFGLFGAATSSFIRNPSRDDPDTPLVENLFSVILRGASAAIVVFLATYGGLGVVSAESVRPDPYVVLFVCFCAAVFSEDAWRWVQGRFLRNLAGDSVPPPLGLSDGGATESPAGPAPVTTSPSGPPSPA